MADDSQDTSIKKQKKTGGRGDGTREDLDQFTVLQETENVDLTARDMQVDPALSGGEDAAAFGVIGTDRSVANKSNSPQGDVERPDSVKPPLAETQQENDVTDNPSANLEALAGGVPSNEQQISGSSAEPNDVAISDDVIQEDSVTSITPNAGDAAVAPSQEESVAPAEAGDVSRQDGLLSNDGGDRNDGNLSQGGGDDGAGNDDGGANDDGGGNDDGGDNGNNGNNGNNNGGDDGNNGHGNDDDGVDDSNPGQGGGKKSGDEKEDRGHGNDEDGVDNNNPGQGGGGPNANKDDSDIADNTSAGTDVDAPGKGPKGSDDVSDSGGDLEMGSMLNESNGDGWHDEVDGAGGAGANNGDAADTGESWVEATNDKGGKGQKGNGKNKDKDDDTDLGGHDIDVSGSQDMDSGNESGGGNEGGF